MSLPFRPIQDVIICQQQTREEKRDSGIVVPELADDRDDALVLAVGPGRRLADGTLRAPTVRPGYIIVFPATRGQRFVYHDTEYVALREEHAIGIVGTELTGDVGLVPLNDFVIAEQLPTEHVNPGGQIVIPGTADDRDEATLLAVGPGRVKEDGTRDPMGLRAGDRVLYNKRMGDHFRLKDRALVAFREEHVVCVTERELEAQPEALPA
jgi:chaperonin GroES